jgi:hypothetical protein
LFRELDDEIDIKIADENNLSVDNVLVEIKRDFYEKMSNSKSQTAENLNEHFAIVVSWNLEVCI